jgi:hypothetical protein
VNRVSALVASLLAIAASAGGCARCGDDPRQGDLPGWARLPLGTSEAGLRSALAAAGGLDAGGAKRFVDCAQLPRADVLDVEEPALAEEAAPGHALVRCTLRGGMFERSGPFSAAWGDLLDGRVFSVAWSFSLYYHDACRRELEAALGPGREVRLEESSALGELQRPAVVWRRDGAQWALIRGLEARIIKQDETARVAFAPLAAPSERGSKVSLDDIGLGGGLDLAKPLPSDEGLVPKDAGAR